MITGITVSMTTFIVSMTTFLYSICPSIRKVYEQLDPKVKDKFETKGVMYIRNYPAKKGYFSEPLLMKGWQAVFDTKDKEVVEQELVKSGMNFEWGVSRILFGV